MSKQPRREPWQPFINAKDAHIVGEDFEVWVNNHYTVLKRLLKSRGQWPDMIHLSIRRNDRDVIRDWRDLQRIKNELVGPECEGVELYPAESRLVDQANQFHLWALAEPGVRFPFGYAERMVTDQATVRVDGGQPSQQRPFDDDNRPKDCLTQEQVDKAIEEYKKQGKRI